MFNNKSIAVLPFENMSSDPDNEYFSDGMTEEIINALSKISALKVTARTSSFVFKNSKEDVRIIGNQLGVATVLEGSIRKSGNRIRVTAQLIRTDNGFHIWSENFDRELTDVFELQDEISLLIADKIRENYGHLDIQDHLIEAPTENIEAYQLYLKARYNHLKWDGEGIRNAMLYYQQSIELAPDFSLPYFGMGYCCAMSASWGEAPELLEVANGFITQGFELDSESYLGYFAKATLSFWGNWELIEGAQFFNKAIQLSPAHTEAEEGLIELYTATGHFDLALDHVENILRINPLSTNHHFSKANIFYLKQDFSNALVNAEKALQIDPAFTHAIGLKQLCLILSKRKQELDYFLKTTPLPEATAHCKMLYELVHADVVTEKMTEQANELFDVELGVTLFPWTLFLLTYLNKHEEALDKLEHALKNKRGQYINFLNIPFLKPLHHHVRFQTLVAQTFNEVKSLVPASGKTITASAHKNLLEEKEVQEALEKLNKLIQRDQVFLNNELSLRSLAGMLNIHPNKLSWMLNKHLGKNFNEYINAFRLEVFKYKAQDPTNKHLTLLALAFECGFNSKSVFNEAFKKSTGLTPKAWLKQKN